MRSSRAGEPAADKEGWLTKKGEKRRNWKMRWFVLRKGSLTYAKKAGDRPKGLISLKSPTLAKSTHKPFCFAINVTTRTYLITAKSTEEMNSWLTAILDACELPAQEKEVMRAEAQIVQALADDGTGTLQRNPQKKVVIVLRNKADIERERPGTVTDADGSAIRISFKEKEREVPMSAGQQLSPRTPTSPRSPRRTQSARGVILKRSDASNPNLKSEGSSGKELSPSASGSGIGGVGLTKKPSRDAILPADGRQSLSGGPSPQKPVLGRTLSYAPGMNNAVTHSAPSPAAPPNSVQATAPGSSLPMERKTERSATALDDNLFALLDDLAEIVKTGGAASPPPPSPHQQTEMDRRGSNALPNPPPTPLNVSSAMLPLSASNDRLRAMSYGDTRASAPGGSQHMSEEKSRAQNYRKSMMVVMFEGEKRLANLKEEKRVVQEELIATLDIKTRLDAQVAEINRQLSEVDRQYRGMLERIRKIEEEMIHTMEQTENQKRSAARLAQVDDQTTKRVAVEVKRKVAEMNSEGRARRGTGLVRPQPIVPKIAAAGVEPDSPATPDTPADGSHVEEKRVGFFARFGNRSPRAVAEDITEEEMRQWLAPLQRPFLKWADADASFGNGDLITPIKNDYNLELGSATVRGLPTQPQFEEDDRYFPFYLKIFFQKDHVNFLAMDDAVGPVVVSVESPPKDRRVRCLVRTKKEDQHLVLPSAKDRRKALLAAVPELAHLKFHTSDDASLQTDLVSFERPYAETKYKFGILYCRGNQSAEDEMYNNVDTSAEFEEFLDFMGERILLQGWDKFRGGLNVTNGGTGKYSIYTNFRNQEVMFHVATMLPFKSEDPQQLERKRHLGNDVVLIVFKDGDSGVPFNPKVIRSQFNHIFVVIQVDTTKPPNQRHYRIAITTKGGVPSFGPPLPAGGSFEKSPELRNFLLTKLINGERAATLHAPDFRTKSSTARKLFLEEMVLSYGSKK